MMRKSAGLILIAVTGLWSVQVSAAEICDRIDDFVKAQLADPDKPHWVEMHWGFDPGAIWSKACRPSDDEPSKQFCHWLFENSSYEFRSTVPIRILECYGYRFPKRAANDWTVYDGEFRPEHSEEGVWLTLELATKGLREGESALRLSVVDIDPDSSFDSDELPAIERLPDDEAGPA